jgi:peptidoglycan biosynthesis protein MviN/MurJ (putative lipid II flippase)
MKPKMTEDFKKGAKSMVFYMITAIIVFPMFHLIKGDFTWGDTLINAGLMVVICLVLAVFFYFGMQVPKKTDDSAKE